MIKTVTLLSILLVLLTSCGSPFAGTGQHGEAKIVGIAMTSTGTVAADQPITVADSDYITSSSSIQTRAQAARGTVSPDTVYTDSTGRFEIVLEPGRIVTLSSRLDSSLLYLSDIIIPDGEKNLDTVGFTAGNAVTIYPWWSEDGAGDKFTVKGTDWSYVLDDTGASQIYLPGETVDLIHYDQDSVVTIEIDAGTTDHIGEKKEENTVKLFAIAESVPVLTEVVMEITQTFDIPVVYYIYWGEKTEPVKTDLGRITHKYEMPGTYTITVEVYPAGDNGGYEKGPIVEYSRDIMVTEKEGDENTTKEG